MSLIIPEVYKDCVNSKLTTSLRIGSVAYDATPETILEYGSTVHFPVFVRNTETTEIVKGTPLVPSGIDMTECTATCKQVGTAKRVFDVENATIKSAVMENMIEQTVDAIREKIDGDLVDAMDADAQKVSPMETATTITADNIYDAMALFGDDVDTADWAALIIPSKLMKSMLKMEEFTSLEKTYQSANNGIIENGCIGWFNGIKVIISDRKTYDSTLKECKAYLVKRNALGIVLKKAVSVEESRESLLLATDIVSSTFYACKLIDKSGVCIIKKTVI